MRGPDTRPEVRIAFLNPDGSVDTTGQWGFHYFESLPMVGDILVEPRLLDDEPEAVVVVGRQFIKPLGDEPRWWVLVRPVEPSRWREVWDLDAEVNQAFVEMAEERDREVMEHLLEEARQRKAEKQKVARKRK